MIRSIDTLQRNFNVLQERQKNLSANTANITTPGFKYQELIQSTLPNDLAINYAGGPRLIERHELGDYTFGNQIDEAYVHMESGNLQETGIPTDFAINGDGFFTVQGPNGLLYTKNGRFTVDENGQLVTREGYPVQMNENIFFDQNTMIDEYGYINGAANQLVITVFDEATGELTPTDNGYFEGAGGQVTTANSLIHQGYLESSNVQMADTMVELLQITREFEANQKVLHASNETLQKATNEIGKA